MAVLIVMAVIFGVIFLIGPVEFFGLFASNLPETNAGFRGNFGAFFEFFKAVAIVVVGLWAIAFIVAKITNNPIMNNNSANTQKPSPASRLNLNPNWSSPPPPYAQQIGTLRTQKWHGTPTISNAMDIMQHQGSWIARDGNASGTGVYLASKSMARGYAIGGALIQVSINIPRSQIADYNQVTSSSGFRSWRRLNGTGNHGDDISEYIITQLGQRYLDAGGGIIVALVRPSDKHQLVKIEGLTAVAAYDLRGNKIA